MSGDSHTQSRAPKESGKHDNAEEPGKSGAPEEPGKFGKPGKTTQQDLTEVRLTGSRVINKGMWGRFLHLIRLAKVPWLGIVVYFCVNLTTVYVAVNLPQVNADIYTGNASVANIAWVIIVELVSGLLVSVLLAAYGVIGGRIDRNLRNAVWDKILRLPPKYFDKVSATTLLSRMTDDAESMKDFILLIISELTGITTTIAVIAAMATMNRGLAVIMIIFVPVITLFGFAFGRIRMIFGNTVKFKMANLTEYLSGHLARIMVIKAFNREDAETKHGEEEIRAYYIAQKKAQIIEFLYWTAAGFINLAPDIALLLVGIYLLESKELTPAGWIVFYAYANNLLYFFSSKIDTWISIKQYQGHLNRLSELFAVPDEEDSARARGADKADDMCAETGDIHFVDVSFAYEDRQILSHAELTIPEKRFTAIFGPSGSGKTTLLKLLERMYEPDEGTIVLNDQPIDAYNLRTWREQIAYVKQDSPLISGSIRENVLYGVKEDLSDEEIMQAARQIHADTLIMSCPQGLDYEVGQFGSKLSGGQRQKLSVLRAFLQNREYILLDEPTASLDVLSAHEVVESVKELIGKRTVILVAHDNKLIHEADHIIVVEDNTHLYEGNLEEVAQSSAFIREMLDTEEERA